MFYLVTAFEFLLSLNWPPVAPVITRYRTAHVCRLTSNRNDDANRN
jgi:hypothetical protein